jgi:hypothetical protein
MSAQSPVSAGELRNIPFAQVGGKTVTILPETTQYLIAPPSPGLAGKLAVKDFQAEVANIIRNEKVRPAPGNAVSPLFRPALTPHALFGGANQTVQLTNPLDGVRINFLGGPQNINKILDRVRNATLLTGAAAIAAIAGGLALGGLAVGGGAAGGAAGATGAAAWLARVAPRAFNLITRTAGGAAGAIAGQSGNILRAGALLGALGLGKQGYDYLSSKIPAPSNTTVVDDVKNAIDGAKDKGKQAIENAVNDAKNAINNAVGSFKDTVSSAIKDVTSGVTSNVAGSIRDTFTGAVSSLQDSFGGGGISDFIEEVKNNKLLKYGLIAGSVVLVGGTAYALTRRSK